MFRGVSLATGWGEGLHSLPKDAVAAAAGKQILPLPTLIVDDDRLRRATRECLLAIAAVETALRHSPWSAADLAGQRTALVYASASSYISANWSFLHADASSVVYFPYTAPSAVPGEVSMYFNITGPYLSFLSGANAGLEALWHAVTLLNTGQCERALVLVVETFSECEELFLLTRRLVSFPLVETTLCVLLERHPTLGTVSYDAGNATNGGLVHALATSALFQAVQERQGTPALALCGPTLRDGQEIARQLQTHWPLVADLPLAVVNARTGTCLAATPLVGLLLALAETQREQILCISHWGEAWSMVGWPRGSL